MRLPVALELFTVREEIERDFFGTLEKVAAMGYEGVEFSGFGGIEAADMKAQLDRLGLKAIGCHTGTDMLYNKLDELIRYNRVIDNEYIVLAYDTHETEQEWLEEIGMYIKVGEELRDNGFQFCYHNHEHEFVRYGGIPILDTIFKLAGHDILKAELDVYWIYYAGMSPEEYIYKLSGRCPILHMKDMRRDEKDTAEVGEGLIDMDQIIRAAYETNVKWLVVEQDNCLKPPLESAAVSIRNLKRLQKI